MPSITNDFLDITIAEQGAELQSIIHKHTNLEYLWSGDPAFWAKKSPVLFPIVGGLKNNSYTYKGNTYSLNRHGFAREMPFVVTAQSRQSITFSLSDTEATLAKYPFHFIFSINYTVDQNRLHVTYHVKNTGQENMLFSVGAHPAFKLPLEIGAAYTDYYLQFSEVENAGRWPLSADGLIEAAPAALLENTDRLPLQKTLFYQDAVVFKHLKSETISIKSNKTKHGVSLNFPGFPYMGIWGAKDADFVCIEPWCGIADSVNTTGGLADKEGIQTLPPLVTFTRGWSVEIF